MPASLEQFYKKCLKLVSENSSSIMVSIIVRLSPEYEKIIFYPIADPFACDCGLAWLIRDNRTLLTSTSGGTCADSKPFETLDPN